MNFSTGHALVVETEKNAGKKDRREKPPFLVVISIPQVKFDIEKFRVTDISCLARDCLWLTWDVYIFIRTISKFWLTRFFLKVGI